ncbi:MAG: hypothetical protein ACREIF_08665 [Chthoniobacterales bacterium]
MGSTRYLADGSKTMIEQYTDDVYGTPTIYAPDGITVLTVSAFGADHFFTGRQWHPIRLPLARFRARELFVEPSRRVQGDVIRAPALNHSEPGGQFSHQCFLLS